MHTAVPTISAVALPARSVQPKRRKIALVPSRVAIVIPDVGFEVTPTNPTIRALTVTKKKAKTAMRIEATNRTGIESMYPRIPGTRVSTARIPITQSTMVRKERSRSILSTAVEAPVEI